MDAYVTYRIDSSEVFLYEYSDSSIALISSKEFAEKHLEKLKQFGRYNPNLSIGKGWIFSKKRQPEIETFLKELVSSGTTAAAERAEPASKPAVVRRQLPTPTSTIKPKSRLPALLNELYTELGKIKGKESHRMNDDYKIMVFPVDDETPDDLESILVLATGTHRLMVVPT